MAVALVISFANFSAKYTGDPKGSAPSSSRSEKLKNKPLLFFAKENI